MSPLKKTCIAALVPAILLLPLALRANISGAEPRLTAAPGESNCMSCHTGTRVNGGSGRVSIWLANGSTVYQPGVTQRIEVQVSDPSQRRWGFELSARVGTGTAQSGRLVSIDGNTQVETAGGIQYITHTMAGTRLGTTAEATFAFDWTPPATDVGPITLYADVLRTRFDGLIRCGGCDGIGRHSSREDTSNPR